MDQEQHKSSQHLHRFKANAFLVGLPFLSFNGPGIPSIRAQKLFLLFFSDSVRPGFLVTGAFKLLPVARLYFARPFAVRPPFLDFSPLPKVKLTDLRFVIFPPLPVPFYGLG